MQTMELLEEYRSQGKSKYHLARRCCTDVFFPIAVLLSLCFSIYTVHKVNSISDQMGEQQKNDAKWRDAMLEKMSTCLASQSNPQTLSSLEKSPVECEGIRSLWNAIQSLNSSMETFTLTIDTLGTDFKSFRTGLNQTFGKVLDLTIRIDTSVNQTTKKIDEIRNSSSSLIHHAGKHSLKLGEIIEGHTNSTSQLLNSVNSRYDDMEHLIRNCDIQSLQTSMDKFKAVLGNVEIDFNAFHNDINHTLGQIHNLTVRLDVSLNQTTKHMIDTSRNTAGTTTTASTPTTTTTTAATTIPAAESACPAMLQGHFTESQCTGTCVITSGTFTCFRGAAISLHDDRIFHGTNSLEDCQARCSNVTGLVLKSLDYSDMDGWCACSSKAPAHENVTVLSVKGYQVQLCVPNCQEASSNTAPMTTTASATTTTTTTAATTKTTTTAATTIPAADFKVCKGAKVEDSCFEFVDERKNWSEAREVCKRRGEYLAEVKTLAEAEQIEFFRPKEDGLWLGGRKVNGLWKWDNSGTDVNMRSSDGFQQWRTDQPNGSGRQGEECLGHLKLMNGGHWIDGLCHFRAPFVCQFKIASSNTAPTTTTASATTATTTAATTTNAAEPACPAMLQGHFTESQCMGTCDITSGTFTCLRGAGFSGHDDHTFHGTKSLRDCQALCSNVDGLVLKSLAYDGLHDWCACSSKAPAHENVRVFSSTGYQVQLCVPHCQEELHL